MFYVHQEIYIILLMFIADGSASSLYLLFEVSMVRATKSVVTPIDQQFYCSSFVDGFDGALKKLYKLTQPQYVQYAMSEHHKIK